MLDYSAAVYVRKAIIITKMFTVPTVATVLYGTVSGYVELKSCRDQRMHT